MVGACVGKMSGSCVGLCVGYAVHGWFLLVQSNAGDTDGSRRGKKGKSSACKGNIFHKYDSLAVQLIPVLKESCLAMTLLLIQYVCPTYFLTLDHGFIVFLLHGIMQV